MGQLARLACRLIWDALPQEQLGTSDEQAAPQHVACCTSLLTNCWAVLQSLSSSKRSQCGCAGLVAGTAQQPDLQNSLTC